MTSRTYNLEARGGFVIYGPGRLSVEKAVVQRGSLLERLQHDAMIGKSRAASEGKYRVYMICHDGINVVREMLFWMPLQDFLDIDEDDFLELIKDMKSRTSLTFLNIEEPNTTEFWVDIFVQDEGEWKLIPPTSSSDQSPPQHTFFEGNLGVSIIPLLKNRVYRLEVPCRMKVTVCIELDQNIIA
jgi:hypothetical protein